VNLNIRGLGGIKARYLRHIILCEGANLLNLWETKVNSFSDARGYSLWRDNKVGCIHNGGDKGVGAF